MNRAKKIAKLKEELLNLVANITAENADNTVGDVTLKIQELRWEIYESEGEE